MSRISMIRMALVASLLPAFAHAEGDPPPTDVEGSKDHPAVKRYPGAWITEYNEREFEAMPFPLADTAEGVKSKSVEGKFYYANLSYPGKVSCTQIRRNYENAFKAAGLTIHQGVNSPWDQGWSGDKLGWVSAEGRAKAQGAQLYIIVSCGENNANPDGFIRVVEQAAMEQKVEIDAAGMASEIEKSGRVALYGITFATGKADITADSGKTLGAIAGLLEQKKDWKLRIDGHTDNVGNAKANLELSKKRAAAVKDYLVKQQKVAAARLTTEGFGDSRPLAPNTTDEARARNRRVELTKL